MSRLERAARLSFGYCIVSRDTKVACPGVIAAGYFVCLAGRMRHRVREVRVCELAHERGKGEGQAFVP